MEKLILALLRITVVYSIVSIAVIAVAFRFLVPFLEKSTGHLGAFVGSFGHYSVYFSFSPGHYD